MKPSPLFVLSAVLCFAFVSELYAQQPTTPSHVDVPTIEARSQDVSTIDGVMKAFYEVISGPSGQPRQWSRDRTLYVPDIRFVAMSEDKDGRPQAHVVTHQQFVDMADPQMVKEGFSETEIHRVTQSFGHIAHIFSTYETRAKAAGPVTGRGINSVELFYDGKRWWVASVIWDDERPDNPISPDYLPKQ